MRITNSRDGVRRTTLRIEVRMGRDDFIQTLALAAVNGCVPGADPVLDDSDLADLPEAMPRDRIIDAVKSATAQYGYDARDWWRDNVTCADDLEEWATEVVDSAFPEFGGQ